MTSWHTCRGMQISRREGSGIFNQAGNYNLGEQEDAWVTEKKCIDTNFLE